jgi:UDP-glucose 4-epimerase
MEHTLRALKMREMPERIFVTGGAGFIGSHIVDTFMAAGRKVTVYDNLSSGKIESIEPHLPSPNFRFVEADLLAYETLRRAMSGHDLIWHLGGNGDIPGGYENTTLDLYNSVTATRNVLEAMKQNGVRDLLFASSGAVYGDTKCVPTAETEGPLLPVSLYGAGKIAGESFISAYCHLFGLRAYIFRFGNVVGSRMCRGAIHDFILKLQKSPSELEILGDGAQVKNYFLVEECIEGMVHAYCHIPLSDEEPCIILNLGASKSTGLMTIVEAVCESMGLSNVDKRFVGGKGGWPGDQPRVCLDVSKVGEYGWRARHSSDEAIRIAVKRMVQNLSPQATPAPSKERS